MSIRARRWPAILCVAACVVVVSLASRARADNFYWIGGNSTQYGDGQNWSLFEGSGVPPAGAIPGSNDFAVFEKGASVDFSGFSPGQPPATGNLEILNGGVSFTLGPISYQDAVARTYVTSELYVVAPFEDGTFLQNYNLPNGANGSLFVSGGTMVVNGPTEIGGGAASNVGTLTLQASLLETTGDVSVAQSSHGNFNIGTASLVTSTGGNVTIGGQFGSTGAATVSGGSAWQLSASAPLTVGVQGTGSLLVEGGSLVSGVTLNIGSSGPAPASVTVDGPGSQVSFTQLSVGSVGNGSLTIQNGGAVVSGSSDGSNQTSIGTLEGMTGAATVTGQGSSWITNGLVVGGGNTGSGSLTISAGASVTSADSSIGGGHGLVQITDSGSSWTINGGLSISPFCSASLVVGAGSTVNVAATMQVNSGGAVQLAGTLNAATLNVAGGSFLQTGVVNLSDAATHVGVLSISNGGAYTGSPVLGVPSVGNTDATGYAYVQGLGSTWTIPAPYFLGAGGGPVTANVSLGGTVQSGDLGIGENTAGQLQVDGQSSAWSSSGIITVGTVASGSIDISNGGSVSASTLQMNANGTVNASTNGALTATNLNINGGKVKVNGGALTTSSTTVISGSLQLTTSNWKNSGTLYVGGDGSNPSSGNAGASFFMNGGSASIGSLLKIWPAGQVAIDGGASLNLNSVDIEGGSLDIYSGEVSGSGGSLTVAAHGEYSQLNGDFNAGDFPSVTVNGSLFNIANGSINLGAGQSLGAANGAIVSAPGGLLNIGSGASVSITDSTVNAAQIYIAGSLTLSNAAVQTPSVNLDGGTITTATPLVIDSLQGHGTINGDVQLAGGSLAANGCGLAVTGDIAGYGVLVGNVTAASESPTGDLTVSGSHIDLGSQSVVLLSEHSAQISGHLYSDGGILTSAAGIAVTAAGVLDGTITVNGDVTNDGLINVGGDAIGLDTIYGNLVFDSAGTVRVQIGGTDPSDYDHIMVKDGNVTLGGTLDLVFINGFLPKQGDVFNIFIDDFSGSFSTLQVEGLGNWQYSVQGGPNGVALNSLADAPSQFQSRARSRCLALPLPAFGGLGNAAAGNLRNDLP